MRRSQSARSAQVSTSPTCSAPVPTGCQARSATSLRTDTSRTRGSCASAAARASRR
ncbi:hypothetical protein [Ornithinimicrobium kibberense]|uniref:hypothetical protein n=1 Tax=Ornithinimicrobium kibberense TaxID=282060 RepID=UPI0036173E47